MDLITPAYRRRVFSLGPLVFGRKRPSRLATCSVLVSRRLKWSPYASLLSRVIPRYFNVFWTRILSSPSLSHDNGGFFNRGKLWSHTASVLLAAILSPRFWILAVTAATPASASQRACPWPATRYYHGVVGVAHHLGANWECCIQHLVKSQVPQERSENRPLLCVFCACEYLASCGYVVYCFWCQVHFLHLSSCMLVSFIMCLR